MEVQELYQSMKVLKESFDLVRLVDVTRAVVVVVSEGGVLSQEPYQCFAVWNKARRCENCISAKAYACQGELTKFEFLDNQVCFVMARYVTVGDVAYILEMVKFIDDKTLFGAYGKSDFIEKITAYNDKIYTDSLTGSYNRRYFDEQLAGLRNITAVAELDLDNFKAVNDTFGHDAGDAVLQAFAKALMQGIRPADAVIRLGGDEFVIVFQGLREVDLLPRLEALRERVEALVIPDYPTLRITTSIGGFYCGQCEGDFLEIADKKLYKAKKRKNAVEV